MSDLVDHEPSVEESPLPIALRVTERAALLELAELLGEIAADLWLAERIDLD